MRHHAFDQWLCEFAHALWRGAKCPELIDLIRGLSPLKITPEMILNCGFPGAPSFTHYRSAIWKSPLLCLLRTSAKTFAISTAARAAWVPRLILFSRQRARACFSSSKLST